jgi:hypothetical protein
MNLMGYFRVWLLLATLAALVATTFGASGTNTPRASPRGTRITFLFGHLWAEVGHIKWDGRDVYPCPYMYLGAPRHTDPILLLGPVDSVGITVLARVGHRWQARRVLKQVAKSSKYSLSLET